jgi:hypothetical protein
MKNIRCILGIHNYKEILHTYSRIVEFTSGAKFERTTRKCSRCNKMKYFYLSIKIDDSVFEHNNYHG